MMQELSQATSNPESHLSIMTGEKYLTNLVKVQVSQDPILIHSAVSALGNFRNGLGTGSVNSLCSIIEESATAFEVDQTKMLARKNKKGKTPYI